MRAVVCHGFGSPSVMKVCSVPIPKVEPLQVLVRVKAAGVNRGDIVQRMGHYPPPPGVTDILGLEAAGVVESIGSDVSSLKVGDRVMALLGGGGYADCVAVNETHCMPIPDQLDFITAAAIPETFLTAFQAIRLHTTTKAGDKVLFHAGASGVGTAGCQLARHFGATTIVTCSENKIEKKRGIADHIVSRHDVSTIAERVCDKVGENSVDLIVDPIFGGGYLEQNVKMLAVDGTVVVLGFMAGHKLPGMSALPLFAKRASIKFSTLRSQSDGYKANLVRQFSESCYSALALGQLKPIVQEVMPLEEASKAHEFMATNGTVGKLVLTM